MVRTSQTVGVAKRRKVRCGLIRLIAVTRRTRIVGERLVEHGLVVRAEMVTATRLAPAVHRPWVREEMAIVYTAAICPIHHHVLRWRIIIGVGSCGMISNVPVSEYRRHIQCRIRELSVYAVASLDLTLSSTLHAPIITANITSIIVSVIIATRRRNFICR